VIDSVLVDTNIHVYPYDAAEPVKGARAARILLRLVREDVAVVTPQVLGEFFLCLSRQAKLGHPVAFSIRQVRILAASARVLPVTAAVVEEAMRGVARYGMAYYDAQLWAAARLAAVPALLTEDGPCGSEIEGVRFVNPFTEDFDLDAFLAD
jgi:predicted nucleic acid-binding protein